MDDGVTALFSGMAAGWVYSGSAGISLETQQEKKSSIGHLVSTQCLGHLVSKIGHSVSKQHLGHLLSTQYFLPL